MLLRITVGPAEGGPTLAHESRQPHFLVATATPVRRLRRLRRCLPGRRGLRRFDQRHGFGDGADPGFLHGGFGRSGALLLGAEVSVAFGAEVVVSCGAEEAAIVDTRLQLRGWKAHAIVLLRTHVLVPVLCSVLCVLLCY